MPCVNLPLNISWHPAVQRITDVTGIADSHWFLQHFANHFNVDNVNKDSLDLAIDKAKPTIYLKQIEPPWLKFDNIVEQHNQSGFNKWNNAWVAWIVENKHRGIISRLKFLQTISDGVASWETVVGDFVVILEIWQLCETLDITVWSWRQWWKILVEKLEINVQKSRNKGRGSNSVRALDWSENDRKTENVTSLSDQRQISCLQFAGNRPDRLLWCPPIHSKLNIQMHSNERIWLILPTKKEGERVMHFAVDWQAHH
jgi:hypothetical protein